MLSFLLPRFLSSIFERLPISFKMKIYPSPEDDERLSLPPPPPQSRAILPFRLSCFSDTGCMEASEEPSRVSSGTYTTLEESLDSDTVYLQTRKPVWNREIKHWVHNFGGRVRVPSNKNFLVVQCSAAEHYNATQFLAPSAARSSGASAAAVTSAVEAQSTDRVCIRHGQVRWTALLVCNRCRRRLIVALLQRTSDTYILDYRAPASALVAFAAMCATHAAKPLVNA